MNASRLMLIACALFCTHLSPAQSAYAKAQAPHRAQAQQSDAACFSPRERVLFGGVSMTLPEAEASNQPTVTMVSQNSTLDHLIFEEVPIASFYHHSYKDGLITIETYAGDTLRVTLTHAVVLASGEYIMAQHVQPEMHLWGADGDVVVMATHQSPYEGEVWHVVTTTGAEERRPLVSQNLLSGALAAQKALIAASGQAH